MRIAFIHYNLKSSSIIKGFFAGNDSIKLSEFFLFKNRIIDENSFEILPSEIADHFDVYALDQNIPHLKKENLHHYFESHGLSNLYGAPHTFYPSSHSFLNPVIKELKNSDNIEKSLVDVWTSIPHPVTIRRKEFVPDQVSSIHEFRLYTLPHLLRGECLECIHHPKGQTLICTAMRNTRGKEVYTTPIFEQIKTTHGSKIVTFNASDEEKQSILKNLESFFLHHPTIPTLHVELLKNKQGIYLIHATPINTLSKDLLPETLTAVGISTTDVLQACLSHTSFKHL